jgi:hypothetical protein
MTEPKPLLGEAGLYRRRSVPSTAIQWTGDNRAAILALEQEGKIPAVSWEVYGVIERLTVATVEPDAGWVPVPLWSWICISYSGVVTVVSHASFFVIYEPAAAPVPSPFAKEAAGAD